MMGSLYETYLQMTGMDVLLLSNGE